MSHAALYVGTVVHERRDTPGHSFSYRVAMPFIDVDETAHLRGLAPMWRAERRAPMSFRRSDFRGDPTTPLATTIRDLVQEREGFRPAGPVKLLALHRTWGWLFNPIALYYCFATDATTLQAVVADVTNTPWGESHAYVIDTRSSLDDLTEQPKSLHVSPFLPMDLNYQFHLSVPGPQCEFSVTVVRGSHVAFRATLSLEQRAFTRRTIVWVLVRHAFLTHRVSLGIYLRAARLYLRRATYFPNQNSTS